MAYEKSLLNRRAGSCHCTKVLSSLPVTNGVLVIEAKEVTIEKKKKKKAILYAVIYRATVLF